MRVLHVNPGRWHSRVDEKIERDRGRNHLFNHGGNMKRARKNARGKAIAKADAKRAVALRKKGVKWSDIGEQLKVDPGALVRAVKKHGLTLPKVTKPSKRRKVDPDKPRKGKYAALVKKHGIPEGARLYREYLAAKATKPAKPRKTKKPEPLETVEVPAPVAKPPKTMKSRAVQPIAVMTPTAIGTVVSEATKKGVKLGLSGRKISMAGTIKNPKLPGIRRPSSITKSPEKKPRKNPIKKKNQLPQNVAIMAGSTVVARLLGVGIGSGLNRRVEEREGTFANIVRDNVSVLAHAVSGVVVSIPYFLKDKKAVKKLPLGKKTDKIAAGGVINFAIALGQRVASEIKARKEEPDQPVEPVEDEVQGTQGLDTVFIPLEEKRNKPSVQFSESVSSDSLGSTICSECTPLSEEIVEVEKSEDEFFETNWEE